MPESNKFGSYDAGDIAIFLVETNSFVLHRHRFTKTILQNFIPKRGGHTRNFVTSATTPKNLSAKLFESLNEKFFNNIGLQSMYFATCNGLIDIRDFFNIQHVFGQRPFTQKIFQLVRIETFIDDAVQSLNNFRVVAVTNCLNEQFAQRLVVERNFAENVKNFSTERSPFV